MENINEDSKIVRKELLHIAYSNLPSSLFVLSLIIVALAFSFWNIADKTMLTLWGFLVLFVLFLRLKEAKYSLKNKEILSIEKQEKLFMIKTLLTAVIVGLGIAYLFPNDRPYYQALITMVLAGISAGAAMSLSTHKNIARNYLIILILPYVYCMFNLGTDTYLALAFLPIIFSILLIKFVNTYHQKIVEVIISKYLIEKSEKEKNASQERFHSIFKEAPVGLFTYNKDLIIQQANQNFASFLNTQVEKLINLDIKKLDDQALRPTFETTLKGNKGYYEGQYMSTLSKKTIWINMRAVPMFDSDHNIIGGLGIIEDITQRMELEQKIRHQAFHDNLTGLPNRLTLNEHLKKHLSQVSRNNQFSAILFIDIDHFKTINDTLGHHIGDELLKTFASRANNIVRKEDIVARFGGDEFVILLSDLSSDKIHAAKYSLKIAKKLHNLIKEPIKLEDNTLHITLSIGIKIISSQDSNIHTILKHADTAMYKSKESGRNRISFYDEKLESSISK